MVNKVLKFLNNTFNQEKLFSSIDEDIREIVEPYNLKKVIFIRQPCTGEIKIEFQDPIPSTLIKQLDEYTGLEGTLEKAPHHIELTYTLEKGF